MQNIFNGLKICVYFTTIDLASGFFQIETAEEGRHKMGFSDATGKIREFVRCGFGLKDLPATFYAVVTGTLGSLRQGVKNWLDDIIIGSRMFLEHLATLQDALGRLLEEGVAVNLQKSTFCAP